MAGRSFDMDHRTQERVGWDEIFGALQLIAATLLVMLWAFLLVVTPFALIGLLIYGLMR